MNKIFALTALAISMTTSAFAGSATPFQPDADVAETSGALDWSGLYVGASFGAASGTLTNAFDISDDLDSNSLFGVFAGYNHQRGNLVFGGEVDYTITTIEFATFTGGLEDTVDLKGRVGYAFGDALVYGVVGYSFTTLNDNPSLAPLSGISVGAGVDYKIGSRFFVGAEYLARNVSGAFDSDPSNTFTDQMVSTVKFRAGVSF